MHRITTADLVVFEQKYEFFYISLNMDIEPEQYADEYHIHSLLGEGGQANVYLGSKDGHSYALKVYASGPTKEAAYKMEAELLAKIKHPHLINMIDHRPQAKIKLAKRPEEKRPLIVLELAEGGELFDYISKTGNFSSELARTYLKQLLSAIAYLAEMGITHRDLKPENILFDRNFNLKVSDFGLARDAKGDLGNGQLTSRVGTQGYRAPEVESGCYEGLKADLFALGVILFIMYKGTPPFMGTRSHDRIYRLIRERRYAQFWQLHQKGREPDFFSDPFKRLINSFLSAEPDRRPTFDALEQDDWMGGNTLSPQQLINEMTARANKIGKTLSKPSIEYRCNQEGYRGDIDFEDEETTQEEVFTHCYFNSHIKTESLPVQQSPTAIYLGNDANFVVGWLNSFLYQQRRDNASFLPDYVQELTFVRYAVDYDEARAELEVKLDFEVEHEDQVQFVLVGALHKSPKGQVGVEWAKKEGNIYLLAAIKTQLTESLLSLM